MTTEQTNTDNGALLPPGKYTAQAVQAYYNESKNTGTTWVQVMFRIVDGPWKDHDVEWSGYLNSQANMSRTFEALLLVGFQGDDVFEFVDNCPTCAPNRVQIVTEEDTYKGVTKAKVRYVNKLGTAVSADEREVIRAQMRIAMAEAKARLGMTSSPSRPVGGGSGSGANSTAHNSSAANKQPYQPKPSVNPDAEPSQDDIPF